MLNMNLGHGGFSVNKLNININININIIIQCRLFCQTYVLLETKAIILCLCFTFEITNWTGRRLWRISIGITTKKGRKAGCTILMHRTLQWKYTLLRRLLRSSLLLLLLFHYFLLLFITFAYVSV